MSKEIINIRRIQNVIPNSPFSNDNIFTNNQNSINYYKSRLKFNPYEEATVKIISRKQENDKNKKPNYQILSQYSNTLSLVLNNTSYIDNSSLTNNSNDRSIPVVVNKRKI